MKTPKLAFLGSLAFVFLGLGTSFAGSVAWSNADDNNGAGVNSLSDAFGVNLLPGNLLLIGSFNISDSTIQANSGNISFLLSHFSQYGSSTIGSGVGNTPGLFYQNTIANLDTAGVAGQRIYIWAFNSPIATTATQQGIFSQSALNNWIFPHESDIPNATSVDLSNLTNANGTSLVAGANIVIGSFGQSPFNGRDFELALIPEPSTYTLVLLGGIALVVVRRRARAIRG